MGKQLAIGSAILEPSEPCVRCAFTSIAQEPGIPFDKRIHTAISQRLDGNLGVYCKVVKAGTVRVGDEMRVTESAVAR
jgi:uncharacterized protein YcbX